MEGGPARRAWLTRDALLLCLSAFFADTGYQAVAAVFPLFLVYQMGESAIYVGLFFALAYGIGSLFAYVGGRAGDRFNKKYVALAGNLLIPLMSLSGLSASVAVAGGLFVAGWWARYSRTPARRAWLVEVTDPQYRSKVFGFLHALDVGGGVLAVSYSVVLLLVHVSYTDVLLVTVLPLLLSSLCLVLARRPSPATAAAPRARPTGSAAGQGDAVVAYRALLASATLFGFSFYSFGFPILTVAQAQSGGSLSEMSALAVVTFGVYLGLSALAGIVLGGRHLRPIRAIWSIGYLVAAFASLAIGTLYLVGASAFPFYAAAGALGFATGCVETFEPTLISNLVAAHRLSEGMGWLSMTRAVGLFTANLVLGVLFGLNEFYAYVYAFSTAVVAAAILAYAERRTRRTAGAEPGSSTS
ncbi:MAG TPA: MFS transporter [Thermoplasmata archaeon]|nr:MFS transporter [Thermoplasmata archaeon]